MTDSKAFRSVVTYRGVKYKALAAILGITPYGLQKKIDNQSEFKASEIVKLTAALQLSERDRDRIFFCRGS